MSVPISPEPDRILSLYPCSRGLGYAVMDSPLEVVGTGLLSPKKYSAKKLMVHVRKFVSAYGPVTIIMEDIGDRYSRKGWRTKRLQQRIQRFAKGKGIPVRKYPRSAIRQEFERWHAFTKYEIAQVLLRNIEVLKPFAYPYRKYPHREHNHEAVFSAVSLGVTHYFRSDITPKN